MSWTTTATLPERQHGPGWTTTATPPGREHGPGWFALLEKIAPFSSRGDLAATVATNYPHSTVALSASGALAATVSPVKTITVAFSAIGGLTTDLHEVHFITAAFSASTDGMTVAVNSGLWATVIGGDQIKDGLSAIITGGHNTGLSATVVPVVTSSIPAAFTGTGALTAVLFSSTGTPAFLTATGALVATASQVYAVALALSGSGALTATVSQQFLTTATLTGSGTLAATIVATYPAAAALSGTGVLAATGIQQQQIPAGFGDA